MPAPTDVNTIEREREPDGSYGLNASELPKDKWTNVIGINGPERPDFSPEELHCLQGYEKSPSGECVGRLKEMSIIKGYYNTTTFLIFIITGLYLGS